MMPTPTPEDREAVKEICSLRNRNIRHGNAPCICDEVAQFLVDHIAAKDREIAELRKTIQGEMSDPNGSIWEAHSAALRRSEQAEAALPSEVGRHLKTREELRDIQLRFKNMEAAYRLCQEEIAAVTKERDDLTKITPSAVFRLEVQKLIDAVVSEHQRLYRVTQVMSVKLERAESEPASLRQPVGNEEEREALRTCEPQSDEEGSKRMSWVDSAMILARALRAKTAALTAEHENFLTAHRQNMELATRNVEMSRALKQAEENATSNENIFERLNTALSTKLKDAEARSQFHLDLSDGFRQELEKAEEKIAALEKK